MSENQMGIYHPGAEIYRTGGNVRLYRFHLNIARLCEDVRPAPIRLNPEDSGVVV